MQNITPLTILILVLLAVFFVTTFYFRSKFKKKSSELKKSKERLIFEESKNTRQKELIEEYRVTTELGKSSPVAMYRRPKTEEEKKSGYDYIHLDSFGSLRKAEKATGIARYRISSSMKRTKFLNHPNMINAMVVFAPLKNELNSNDK